MASRRSCPTLAFVVAAAVAAGAAPALAANADNGANLAKRWCSTCHVVSPAQTQASADAPPFASIAQKPGFSAAQVALFLLDPHPKMPNMNLTRTEAADIAAYIETLRH